MSDVLHFPSKVGIIKDSLSLRDLQPIMDNKLINNITIG